MRQRKRKTFTRTLQSGKTYYKICREARISLRDIGIILNKVIEERQKK